MTGAAVETSPWHFCDAASSVDWLSSFDFSDLPLSSSTEEVDDLAQLLDLDPNDLFLPPFEASILQDLCDVLPLPPDADGVREESDGFSSILEFSGCAYQEISSKATPLALSEHVDMVPQEAADADSLPPKSHSSTESSTHESDAGSSLAVGARVAFDKENCLDNVRDISSHESGMKDTRNHSAASSHKRHHEDTGSDAGGVDKDNVSPSDQLDKRQQRLLRNRELAFESRQRKKCYVSDLEAKCRALEQERNQLQQQLCFSSAENVVLKKELALAKNRKGKDGVAEPAVLFKDSLPLEFLSLLICLLLTAQLSLCVNPSLALVVRTTLLLLPRATKVGGLAKEQVLVSERCFLYILNSVNWLLDRLWYHRLLIFHELLSLEGLQCCAFYRFSVSCILQGQKALMMMIY
ncbi:hypothetical protein GOP47_0015445 [Adiantum capillus-veneris]|uniref:BZIP domain-containing protein n=1 Tax=Adiantum capillus-veneris TaxID=13818 RepID=A0A9D4ZBN6_ADICA|nr:hypothetical protein GOP47_0015445 [Adiantum capillus-veneris]